MNIHWQPTERQKEALVRLEDEILYGGARGGGKTDAGMAWLLYDKDHPRYRGLVIRRNADDLRDWIDRARRMYLPTKAVFSGSPVEITFPKGAIIRTGHLKDEGAYTKYQGHEYQKILIEELTHITREKDYEALLGSCRSTIPELRPQVFATTNPDGDGHEWVKKRFDCLNPDKKPRLFFDEKTGLTKTRIFIPALVEDNPYLMKNDPKYVAFLNSIQDETLRKQWREGSWDEPRVEGAYYISQIEHAMREGRITNVPVEKQLMVDTWWDLGVSDYMAIWMTQAIGKEIRVIDYMEGEGEGIAYYIRELQKKGYVWGTHYLPHDAEVREMTTGVTRKETAESLGLNPIMIVPKLPVDDGIDAVRNIFSKCWFDKTRCELGLKALKNYKKEYDEKRLVWKNAPVHNWASHGADAFRYLAVGFGEYGGMNLGTYNVHDQVNQSINVNDIERKYLSI